MGYELFFRISAKVPLNTLKNAEMYVSTLDRILLAHFRDFFCSLKLLSIHDIYV